MGNESDLEQAQARQTELNTGNLLEPDLLAGEGGWVTNRPSCRTK